jgi:4-amino-4-deoxy-L-arabinose transferase-like glycosyltransferase
MVAKPARADGMLATLRGEWEVYPFLLLFAVWCSLMLEGSLWVDEVTYTSAAASILHGHIFVNLEHPPLAKYIIALGLLVLGNDEVGARAPAILFGLGTLYLTYKCARLLGSRTHALLSMIVLGMTSGFATFAVQAMLDIYVAFFAILLFYLLLRFERERPDLGGKAVRKWSLGFGVVSALLLLTKFYAVFFVAVTFVYLLRRFSGGERPTPAARFLWLGFLVTIGFVYLPYLMRPDLLAYYVVGWNAAHVAVGHRVEVGDGVYQYPPVWSYLYWIYEQGFVYLVALGVVASLMLKKLRARALEPEQRAYLAYVIVPLVALSLFTLKFPRYILPIFPLLAIGVFPLLPIHIGGAVRRFCDSAGWRVSEKAIGVGSTLAVCLLVLAIPSPVVKTLREPGIGIDSHFREVSDAVAQFCLEHPGATIEVVSFHSKALEYYLQKDHAQQKNAHVEMLHYSSSATLDLLKEGRAHLVVDETVNVRYRDTELHAYVRRNALRSVPLGGDLSMFVMRYP